MRLALRTKLGMLLLGNVLMCYRATDGSLRSTNVHFFLLSIL